MIETENQFFESRFAGTYAADDANPFAGSDLERNLFQRFDLLFGIGKVDILEFDPAFKIRAMNETLSRRMLDRQLHDAVQAHQRRACVVEAGSQHATCDSGASVRPVSRVQAISAPIVIDLSAIRYTPTITTAMLASCCTRLAALTLMADSSRAFRLSFPIWPSNCSQRR